VSPYIVTTKRPTEPDAIVRPERIASVSRRAVATLEEARRYALTVADEHEGEMWSPAMLAAVYEFGGEGTVGPLPDGTVIEVEQATWRMLWEQSGLPGTAMTTLRDAERGDRGAQDHIIDAYNARQA
jgi:hypothetical protein